MTPTELIPCPFCGGVNVELHCLNFVASLYQLHHACLNIFHGITITGTKEEVISKWNTRSDRWIPVTERVPEDERKVLACNSCGIATACLAGGEWRSWATTYPLSGTVTHWRELPEMPRKQGK
jgi:hypothetical protein